MAAFLFCAYSSPGFRAKFPQLFQWEVTVVTYQQA